MQISTGLFPQRLPVLGLQGWAGRSACTKPNTRLRGWIQRKQGYRWQSFCKTKEQGRIKWALKSSVLIWHSSLCASVSHTAGVQGHCIPKSHVLSAGLSFQYMFCVENRSGGLCFVSSVQPDLCNKDLKGKTGINSHSISGVFGSTQLLSVKIALGT